MISTMSSIEPHSILYIHVVIEYLYTGVLNMYIIEYLYTSVLNMYIVIEYLYTGVLNMY